MELIDIVKRFPKRFTLNTYPRGVSLAKEGERCEGIHFVLKGRIEIVSFSLSGNKLVYNSIGEGGMFGNGLVYSSFPFYRGDVMTSENTEVAFIRKERLTELLREDEEFLERYLNSQSDFLMKLNAKIKLLSFDGAEERLRYYLHLHKGVIFYRSISSLAEELGLNRETLSRLVSKLEKAKEITRNNHKIESFLE